MSSCLPSALFHRASAKAQIENSKSLSAERKASKAVNRGFTQMDTERNPFKNIIAEAQRAQNNLCYPCVLGTNSDPNFVTFVLFVVTNCLTTKDAKYTKEEIQKRPQRAQRIKFLFVGRRRQTKTFFKLEREVLPKRRLPIGQKRFPQRALRLCGEMSESLSAIIGENLRLKLFGCLARKTLLISFC